MVEKEVPNYMKKNEFRRMLSKEFTPENPYTQYLRVSYKIS